MNFTANLQGLNLADILQVLANGRHKGVATIIHSGASAKVVLCNGRVVYASADTQPRLGFSLVAKGVLSWSDLDRALDFQRERQDNMPLASVLLKLGIVLPERLEQETRLHIGRVFSDLLSWDGGAVYFEPQEINPKLTVVKDGLAIENLLLDAARMEDQDRRSADRELLEFWPGPRNQEPASQA